MEAFKRQICAATLPHLGNRFAFVTVKYSADGRLSICGVEGPKGNGDCAGGCGQCSHMDGWQALPGVDLDKLCAIWKAWHLNDMQAGTPAQMAAVAELRQRVPNADYTYCLAFLRDRGLESDNGYKYGSAWLRIDVPEDVLQFLRDLPAGPHRAPGCWAD